MLSDKSAEDPRQNVRQTSTGSPWIFTAVILILFIGIFAGDILYTSPGSASPRKHANGPSSTDKNASPPKVALLFLTRGPMPLEPVWREFLEASPVSWRHMFSVHVHAPPGHKYPAGNLFAEKEVKDPVLVTWGNHSMMEAEIVLLRAAMGDPRVQTFVLLSDDSIPLYPAVLTYMQLSLESKSRMNSCKDPSDPNDGNIRMAYRWSPAMGDLGFFQDYWRKNSQWFTLKRNHVNVILNDTIIYKAFAKECYVSENRFCVSDEHYIPSLLAYKGLEEECECKGMSTQTVWSKGQSHPKIFRKNDATEDVIRKTFREEGSTEKKNCGEVQSEFFDEWIKGRISVPRGSASAQSILDRPGNALMSPKCPLFARKISFDNVTVWHDALTKFIW